MKKNFLKYNSRIIWIITGALAALTVLLLISFISYSGKINRETVETSYEHYYAMITDDSNSSFWQSVYEAARSAGRENNSYVEMISENLSNEYSVAQLMDIAISSGVDGIIVQADESDEMTELINKADEKNIPVVTLLSDNSNSERLSFVGVSNYTLGNEYGSLILTLAGSKGFEESKIDVVVLMDSNSENSGQHVLFAAIKESVEEEGRERALTHADIVLSSYTYDSSNSFSVEESIRNLFMETKDHLPDVIVCLSDVATASVYQTVVDYNRVGSVNILGYYDSDAILKGIEREVINATVSIDTKGLGKSCIDALSEYYELGNTSQYFTTDISVITKENILEYMEAYNDER